MQIRGKPISYELLFKGAFGNRLRMWRSLEDILKSNYQGTVSMRYKGKAGGGFVAYEVSIYEITSVQNEWIKQGAEQKLITFNESAPDKDLLVQGEVTRFVGGLTLTYSTEKKKMRAALKNASVAKGLKAKLILEHYLSPSSYSDVDVLLECFPGHVIEFSTYSICLGDIPGRNTVIWEVRDY